MHTRSHVQAGFTYIGLLVAVVMLGLMLTVAGRVWSTTEQRERETQLLFVGDEIRNAIGAYYTHRHQYPQSLQDLVDDKRSPEPWRFLRRLYVDPMTGASDWTLILAPGNAGIMGVASKSTLSPIKRTGFAPVDASFKNSECYCFWQFVYQPRYYRNVAPTSTSSGDYR